MCKLLRCANFRVALGELSSRTQTRYVSVHSCGTLYSFVNIDNFAVKIIMWKKSNTLSHTYVPNISSPQQQQKEKRTLCAGIYRALPVVNNDLSCRQLQRILSSPKNNIDEQKGEPICHHSTLRHHALNTRGLTGEGAYMIDEQLVFFFRL